MLILANLRKERIISATLSGTSSTLLRVGGTAHAAYILQLDLYINEKPVCNISQTSGMAEGIRQRHLIVFDEGTMMHKRALEASD